MGTRRYTTVTKAFFDIDDLIIRYLTGETTQLENHRLRSWIEESSENNSYFETIRNIWLASAQVNHEPSALPLKSISRGNDNLSSPFIRTRVLNQLLKIAAILTLVVITGAIVLTQFSKKPGKAANDVIVVEATMGSRAITTLPDGSKVWLNSGSKLFYDGNYNNTVRQVKLIGEAYFSVVTNPQKPFVVKAGNLNIKALGTKFNVKAYPEDPSIVTTLERGIVVIEGKDNTNKSFTVTMKPKETVTYFKNEESVFAKESSEKNHSIASEREPDPSLITIPIKKVEEVKTELFTSWKDQRWVIEKQKLGELAKDFERRYNIRIHFSSDTIKQFHFSGSFENETIEQIMVIMRHTIPLKYNIEKGVIKIGQDNELMRRFYKY